MKELKCQVDKCGTQSDLIYYQHGICEKHWTKHCEGRINLKEEFRIKEAVVKK